MREANGGIDAANVAQFENLISHFCKQAAKAGDANHGHKVQADT